MTAPKWVMVPREPDEAMLIAGMEADCFGRPEAEDDTHALNIWNAMIERAPQPPAGDQWQPISNAPKDREILVYAPAYQGLLPMISTCMWHDDAGFCIDELRGPTHWMPLPQPPPPERKS